MTEKAYEIWKDKFGMYSQKFSWWICEKLEELEQESVPLEEKQKRLKDQQIILENKQKELLDKIEQSKKDIENNKLRLAEKEEQERITKKKLIEMSKNEEIKIIEGIDIYYDNIKFFYSFLSEEQIKALSEDYALNENPKTKTIFEYMKEKGYKKHEKS